VFVPKGTSPDIAGQLNGEINAALRDDKVRKSFADQAQEPAGGSAQQYGRLVREDSEKYARLVKELNGAPTRTRLQGEAKPVADVADVGQPHFVILRRQCIV
jgi:hypothetical protein